MNKPVEIVKNVQLLKVPFESVYTSVFFVLEDREITMYDTATTREDAEHHIFPALSELEKQGFMLKRAVISHFHDDHAGGLRYIAEKYPQAEIYAGDGEYFNSRGFVGVKQVTDGMKISKNLTLYRFFGHSHDCVAIHDMRTNTLLTADAFQGYGILRYGVYGNIGNWLDSIEKAKALDVENMITSHEYFPYGQTAFGKGEVIKYLDGCKVCFGEIYGYIDKCNSEGVVDLKIIANKYNSEKRANFSNHPTIGADFMEIVKAFFEEKE